MEDLEIKTEEWVENIKRLDALRDLVAKFIDEGREKQAVHYNKGRRQILFSVGDMVMKRMHVQSDASKNFAAKLAPKFEGPFEIIEVVSPVTYILKRGEGKNRKVVKTHVSQITKFRPRRK